MCVCMWLCVCVCMWLCARVAVRARIGLEGGEVPSVQLLNLDGVVEGGGVGTPAGDHTLLGRARRSINMSKLKMRVWLVDVALGWVLWWRGPPPTSPVAPSPAKVDK